MTDVIFRRKDATDSGEHESAPMKPISIDETTAKGINVLGAGGIEVEKEDVLERDRLSQERFMAEVLELQFAEPADENEAAWVEVTHNGEYRRCLRNNEPVKLRRGHVAILARAKQLRVTQKKIVNPDGSMGFREVPVAKLTYPFSVISDPSGRKGADWLRQILRNAG